MINLGEGSPTKDNLKAKEAEPGSISEEQEKIIQHRAETLK